MAESDIFKKNLEYLAKNDLVLAKKILNFQKTERPVSIGFSDTSKGELNLLYRSKRRSFFFHSPEGAVEEAFRRSQEIPAGKKIIHIFGVGLGYSFSALRKWLKSDINYQLIFIEPILQVILFLLQTEIGSKLIRHPQVHLYHAKSKYDLIRLMDFLALEFALLKTATATLPAYKKLYPNTSHFFETTMKMKQDGVSATIVEAEHASKPVFTNFILKLLHLSDSYNASSLKSTFSGMPCIICGAGPSLKKNFERLKSLRSKALILAGSSAIPGLTQQGLYPHLGTFFDPYPRVYDRFLNNQHFEMPIFHCTRTFHNVTRYLHGPKLYLRCRSNGLVSYLEDLMQLEGDLLTPHVSVTTFNTAIAAYLGCSPIIYVGVDLAYTDNQSYMNGVVKDADFTEKQNESKEDFEVNESLWSKDIYGEPVLTKSGWILESDTLSLMQKENPSLSFFNATEGGLGMKGIPHLTLKEVEERYLTCDYPTDEWIHASILPRKIRQTNRKSKMFLKEFSRSLRRCSQRYGRVLREMDRLLRRNQKGEDSPTDETFFEEVYQGISEEMAFQYLLTGENQAIEVSMLKLMHFHRAFEESSFLLHQNIRLKLLKTRFIAYKKVSDYYIGALKHLLHIYETDPWT